MNENFSEIPNINNIDNNNEKRGGGKREE